MRPDGAVRLDDADRDLLARLRAMWERRDPPPPGLVDAVLLTLATQELAAEYELLVLVETTDRLAGTRAPADHGTSDHAAAGSDPGTSAARTLTFTGPDVTVVLRVTPTGEGRRRLDGWLSPASARTVALRCGDRERRTTSTAHGRFEIPDVPAGEAVLRLEPTPAGPASGGTASGGPGFGGAGSAGAANGGSAFEVPSSASPRGRGLTTAPIRL